eukprot:scaffold45569_cov71-Phaeocystis_antarctica.AAC.5
MARQSRGLVPCRAHWRHLLRASRRSAAWRVPWVGEGLKEEIAGKWTSRLRDSTEDEVQARPPVNPDEMLELRAVNDISTAHLATLPAIMARQGTSVIATSQQLLDGLREAVGEVQDGYVVERMLMAHPSAATGGGGAALDAPLAV